MAATSTNIATLPGIVPAPAPITDAARRLQSRLWSVTYGLDIVANKTVPLDVGAFVATLRAEYGHLLTSRNPILQWPHFEPTRPATGVLIPWTGVETLWVPPLLWLLLLDNRRCVTTETKEGRRGPVIACLALLVRELGMSLNDDYVCISRLRSFDGEPSAIWCEGERPLAFLMGRFCSNGSSPTLLRALLTLGADPNVPQEFDDGYGDPPVKCSPLYQSLAICLDVAQTLLDYGACLSPVLDVGYIMHAVQHSDDVERHHRLVSLFELNRTALCGLKNPIAMEGIWKNVGVFHYLVCQCIDGSESDSLDIDHVMAMIHAFHTRVGVSLLTPTKTSLDDDEDAPPRPVLQYVRELKQAVWDDTKQRARMQKLIEAIEPMERAERLSLRPLACVAELCLMRSRRSQCLTPELRRMVLRHVPAWAVQA